MSVWQAVVSPHLNVSGNGADLVSVSIPIAPSRLENLLETLAVLTFPVNPEIDHSGQPDTIVEFPAYAGDLDEVRAALARAGFEPQAVRVRAMIERIHPRVAAAAS
ncbi:MAG: hypothetical protein IT158_19715 [Bryobacterales bacterium]|nr:hypothetical protein [Bryobacterales bacterium]